MKTIKRFGTWAVTEAGLDHVGQPTYEIDADQLLSADWVGHMSAKRWVNMVDFTKAFNFALQYHCNQKRAA